MRTFELIEKPDWDAPKAKLTISVDRISLKLASACADYVRNELIRYAKEVAELVELTVTVRGPINFHNETGLWTKLYYKQRNGKRKMEMLFQHQEFEG